jgi:hypothetical protein
MAGKYDKYIIEYDPTRWPKERRPVMARLEDSAAAKLWRLNISENNEEPMQ